MNGISIVIKAFNESAKIDRAIASACAAQAEVAPWPLEVVVVDGLSDDDTAERAARWTRHKPVRVVQLLDARDRNCAAGVELGYRWSHGRWVLLMDGDMVLQPGFLRAALDHLQDDPTLGAVGGAITDVAIRNGTDRIRQTNGLGSTAGERPWLEGGGLYRREAVRQAGGYAADLRLAAFEEADLGLRLRRCGWRLVRLPQVAMLHDGHEQGTVQLLARRWRSGRAQAAGRLLRLHLGRRGSADVLRLLAHPLILGLTWATLPAVGPAAAGVIALGAGAAHWWRKRNAAHLLTSWADWHLMLAGIVAGAVLPMPERPRMPPSRLLAGDGKAMPQGAPLRSTQAQAA